MDDQINFTLERIPKETREVTFSDGSVMRVTAPASQFEEWDAEEQNDENAYSQISDGDNSELPPPISEVPDTSIVDSEQPSIEMLTAEIKMYLHIANQSIIEVGKRLILAKELVQHGEWQNWLKQNFNLTQQSANRFMRVAERFGKMNIDVHFRPFDFSNFKPTQLIELLALPEGEEQKFIAEKAAEGNPVDKMTIKQLRDEINKFKKDNEYLEKKTSHFEKRVEEAIFEMEKYRRQSEYLTQVADALQEQSDEYKAKLEQRSTVEVPPPDYDDLQREVKELRERPIDVATEFPADYETNKQKLAQMEADKLALRRVLSTRLSLENFLKSLPDDLINSDNLQNVVYSCADDNLQLFEYQLSQISTFISLLQLHLNSWKDDPAYKFPIDRNSITQELMNIGLADSTNSISKQFRQLILNLGFNEVNEIPDDMLPDILKKARTFIP